MIPANFQQKISIKSDTLTCLKKNVTPKERKPGILLHIPANGPLKDILLHFMNTYFMWQWSKSRCTEHKNTYFLVKFIDSPNENEFLKL